MFVSHDDIIVGENWSEIIIKNIKERECFVPLISESYHGANYTEQEFGMAMAMDKKITPVTYDGTNPVGFGSTYQCLPLKPETGIHKLLSAILSTSPGPEYMDIMIDKIRYSGSYDEVADNVSEPFNWIRGGYVLTPQQHDCLNQAFEKNRQVRESFVMHRLIEYLDKQEE